jgi:CRP-like cAMP-binding protein
MGRTTMKSPDYFGEVALIDEGTRMATIRASSEVVCYALTGRDFRASVEKNGVVGWKLQCSKQLGQKPPTGWRINHRYVAGRS